ncbi:MAG: DUF2298 domain-containing protein [Anaerolineae bacterium]|nr:DUF2298 domain-containing protein [Anaerolineae bacterium]
MMLDAILPHAAVWYAWAQAFALAGSLIASGWLRALPDRGYAVGKAFGVLLGGVAYWLHVTLGFARNDLGAALLALATVWVLALWLRDAAHQPAWLWVLLVEVTFAAAFFGWCLVRAHSPEILPAGGEKYMELMMLNAILRSSHFPPNDAWLSGYSLSYYYLGYVLLALLTRLSGMPAAVAFNLGHALVFALTFTSALGAGYALGAHAGRFEMRGAATGFLAAVMLTLMGNLGGLLGVLKCADALPQRFWAWLDVREIATRTYECRGLIPSYFYGWWWDWSRVIRDYAPDGTPQEVITETPIFSFVLGDNHPHVMALPFAVAMLALAFATLNAGVADPRRSAQEAAHFALTALALGALAFLNTWDFPVYGAVFLGAAMLGAVRRGDLSATFAKAVLALGLGYVLYLPWHATFSSQAQGLAVNLFNGTRLAQFFAMFAPLLILWVGYSAYTVACSGNVRQAVLRALVGGVVLIGTLMTLTVALAVLVPSLRALLEAMLVSSEVLGVTRAQVEQRLLARALSPWTPLLLAVGIALVTAELHRMWLSARGNTLTAAQAFGLLLFAVGGLLTLAVEFVFVRDLFGTRMNTVFKFYYQAWALWSIAGALALITLIGAQGWARVLGSIAAAVVGMGLLWAPMAVQARSDFFTHAPTLDGSAYLQRTAPGDAEIINWLNTNVSGDPVILEASTLGAYRLEGRIAAFTGLPTVLGWGGHQHQWRGDIREAARRHALVERAYATTDWKETRAVLQEFRVHYVIVGEVERAQFSDEGLEKFARHCAAVLNTTTGGVYRCKVASE